MTRNDASRESPGSRADRSRSSTNEVADAAALTPVAAPERGDAAPPTTLRALADAVFPNSRAMTREERKAFDAHFWPNVEPITVTDDPPPSALPSVEAGETRMDALRGALEFYANEEWRWAAGRDDCSASLRSFKMDPDDERVRVRSVQDDDALLAATPAPGGDEALRTLASALRKILPPALLAELVAACDVDAPLREFLAALRAPATPTGGA